MGRRRWPVFLVLTFMTAFILGTTVSIAEHRDPNYTVHFVVEPPKVRLVRVGGFYVVGAEGYPTMVKPGLPLLPFRRALVAIPPDGKSLGTSWHAIKTGWVVLDSPVMAAPQPRLLGEGAGEPEEAGSFYGRFVEFRGVIWFRALKMVLVEVYPVWYYPHNRTLAFFRVEVEVEVSRGEEAGYVPGWDRETGWLLSSEARDSGLWLVNPEDARSFGAYRVLRVSYSWNVSALAGRLGSGLFPSASASPLLPEGDYDLVAIVPDSWKSAGERYVSWKKRMGIKSYLATTSWIYSNYDGRDNAWKIREFIKDAYNTWHITYVVLLGDVDYIPTRYIYNPDSDEGGWVPDPTYKPTDWYYAGLDVEWYNTATGEYGDDASHVDWVPEVTVGRIPADSLNELNRYIDKLISYTRDASTTGGWYSRVTFVGAGLDDTVTGMDFKEWLRTHVSQFSSYQFYNLYNTCGQTCGTTNVTRANFMNAVLNGRLYINIFAHGSTDAAWEDHTSLGGWHAFARADDARTLGNGLKLPLIFALSCLTNAFDVNEVGGTRYFGGRSLGEDFVRNSGGGAIIYVGWARVTWGAFEAIGDDGYSQTMDYKFWQYFFTSSQGRYIAGIALFKAKVYYGSSYGGPGLYLEERKKVYTSLHLLGDPALDVWSGQPKETTASYPSRVRPGSSIKVETVPSATVELHNFDWSYYVVKKAGSDGVAVFTAPDYETTLSITVSKHNYVPYLADNAIEVRGIKVSVHVLDDDGDGVGEATVKAFLSGDVVDEDETSPSGWAQLLLDPNTSYTLKVWWRDVLVGEREITTGEDDMTVEMHVKIYRVEVTVKDWGGSPLEGARVLLYDTARSRTVDSKTSSDGGKVVFKAYNSDYSVKVYWQDIKVYEGSLTVSDAPAALEAVTDVYDLSLKVVDGDGNGLANAQMTILHPNGSEIPATTGSEGRFKMSQMAKGEYTVTVLWNQTVVAEKTFTLEPDTEVLIESRVYNFTLLIVDGEEEILPGAKVKISTPWKDKLTLTSDAEGRVHLGLSAGGTYEVTVSYQGVKVGETTHTLEASVELKIPTAVYQLTVSLADSDGNTLAGAKINVHHPNGSIIKTLSDQSGVAQLGRLPKGDYTLEVFWQGILVAENSTTLTSTTTWINTCNVYNPEIRVVGFHERPLGNAILRVRHPNETLFEVMAGPDGEVMFVQVPEGRYEVWVVWDGCTVYYNIIEVTKTRSFLLRAAVYDFTLVLEDSRGQPLGNVTIELLHPNGSRIEQQTENGTISFRNMPGRFSATITNEYELTATYLGVTVYDGRFTVSTGTVEIPLAVYYLTGKPLTTLGTPLPGATAEVSGNASLATQTGATGFVLRLPKGRYTLRIVWSGVEVYRDELTFVGDADLGEFKVDVHVVKLKLAIDTGKPVEGLTVSASGPRMSVKNLTDASGTATFYLVTDSYTFTASYRGYEVYREDASISTSIEIVGRLKLYEIILKVLDQYSKPLNGAVVKITGSNITETLTTNEKGAAKPTLLPKSSFTIEVYWMDVKISHLAIKPQKSGSLELRVELAYLVVDVRNYQNVFSETPTPNANVTLIDESGRHVLTAVSNNMGRAVFEQLPPGSYRLIAIRAAKTEVTVLLSSGQNLLHVTLDETFMGLPRLHTAVILVLPVVVLIAVFIAWRYFYRRRPS